MTIAGFRARNHPQQVGVSGPDDETDDRETAPENFEPLNERFGFTLDVAAAPHNAKTRDFYTRKDDGLAQRWHGRVWCNPPYSDCAAWVRKAWDEWLKEDGPELIVMLLPANRTEQSWWQNGVEPFRDQAGAALRTEFLRGRMRFIRPTATIGPKGDRPPFGCVLLIWSS